MATETTRERLKAAADSYADEQIEASVLEMCEARLLIGRALNRMRHVKRSRWLSYAAERWGITDPDDAKRLAALVAPTGEVL